MSRKWSSETTIKFIREYKRHDCLWNFRSAAYKDRDMRDAAYHNIVKVMDIPDFGVVDVKNKIKNLRSTFNQEKKKMHYSKRSGLGKSAYESNVKWLKELEPMMLLGEKRTTLENIKDEEDEQEEFCVSGDQSSRGSLQAASQASIGLFASSTPSHASPNKRKKVNNSQFIGAVHDLKKDSFEAFGNSVVTQLRKLSEEKALLAQRDIQNILTDYGIEEIRERENIAYQSTLNNRPSSSISTSSSAG